MPHVQAQVPHTLHGAVCIHDKHSTTGGFVCMITWGAVNQHNDLLSYGDSMILAERNFRNPLAGGLRCIVSQTGPFC